MSGGGGGGGGGGGEEEVVLSLIPGVFLNSETQQKQLRQTQLTQSV